MIYTKTLDAAKAALVDRIDWAGGDVLRTAPLTEGDGATSWLQAHRVPDTARWEVDRHTRMPNGMHDQTAELPQVCFFDAFRYCAEKEFAARHAGAQEADVPAYLAAIPDLKAAALASGQPLNEENLPHPALKGRVLVPGIFTEDMMGAAAKTVAAVVAVPAAADLSVPVAIMETPVANEIRDDGWQNQRVIAGDICHSIHQAQRTIYTLAEAKKRDFTPRIHKMSGIAARVIFPPLLFSDLFEDMNLSVIRAFNRSVTKLEKTIKHIPSSPARRSLENVAAMAKLAYAFEEAANLRSRAEKAKNAKAEKLLSKGLHVFTAAAMAAGQPAAEIERLQAGYREGAFPVAGVFETKLAYALKTAIAVCAKTTRKTPSQLFFAQWGSYNFEKIFAQLPDADSLAFAEAPAKALPAP